MNGRFWSRTQELRKLQWLSYADLERRQLKNLKRILSHAYENVPFYHRSFKMADFTPRDFRTLKDLSKIPLLRKEDVRNNFGDMTAANISRKRLKIDSTSGSSGEPLIFYRDTVTDDLKVASDLMNNDWCGIAPGDRILWITHPRQIKLRNLRDYLVRTMWNKITDLHWLSVSDIQEENCERINEFLGRMRPHCLYGYTSGLLMLARCANQLGSNPPDYLRSIVSSAETLSPFNRKTIQQAFNCEVYNRYGCRELGGSVAQDCQVHMGLHVNTELYCVEITDNGHSVSDGEKGQIVVTDLHNMAMPFIRYQMGDIAISEESPCSCGRGFPLIREIVGRETEFINIRTPSGKIVTHPGYFLVLGDFVQHVRQFQFIQEKLDEVIVKIVPNDTFNATIAEEMRSFLSNMFGSDMVLKLEIVNDIPPEKSGKRPIVKSKVPISIVSDFKND